MSRRIDISNPEALSDEDRQYLIERGRTNVLAQVDYLARVDAARANLDSTRPPAPAEDGVIVEEVDEPYDKWKVPELKEELRNRELSDEGLKDELVARLEEHDVRSE